MSITFEFVNDGIIILKENGKVIKEETLDYNAYGIYASVKEANTKLIPTSYYRFMKSKNTLSKIPFDQKFWDDKIGPKLGEKINNCLFSFQRETIYRMITTKRCLNACSPGLGKTIQALSCLTYFNHANGSDIILCPSYLRANWFEEVKKWYPSLESQTSVIWKAGKKELEGVLDKVFKQPGIKIISYDMFATLCGKAGKIGVNPFNTIIMDESHFIKNGKSLRFSTIAKYVKTSKQMFLLSGTPSPNRPNELYTQFSMIAPGVFYDYFTFAHRYCDGHRDKFNRFDDRGSSNTSELAFLMSKLCLRLRREDHLDDLPAITREKITVTPKVISKTFKKKKATFMDLLKQMDDSEETMFKVQSMASEMFRDTAAIKIDPVIEYLGSYIEDDELEKTILFCKHQTMQTSVAEFFDTKGINYIQISGATAMSERMGMIDKFKNDPECTFALLTTGSCSTGLNITPIRKMIFLEMEWSPSILDQSECRINRIGGAKHLHYTYLICDNSLDEMIFNKLKRKTELITQVVDSSKRYGDFEFESDKKKTKYN